MPVEQLSLDALQSISVTVNGTKKSVESKESLATLIVGLGLDPEAVAVELNRVIVRRDRWPQTALSGGDVLEVVHFVGGG